MKQIVLGIVAVAACWAAPSMAQQVLTGDQGDACAAILCLSTGSPPGECTPPLTRYFNITDINFAKEIQKRLNFLNLCPAASMTPQMQSLVSAIANGAGRCDPTSLNSTLTSLVYDPRLDSYKIVVQNQMPDYCAAYTTNPYTDLSTLKPVYVGTPETGGFWTSPANYQSALATYNANLAAQQAANANGWYPGRNR